MAEQEKNPCGRSGTARPVRDLLGTALETTTYILIEKGSLSEYTGYSTLDLGHSQNAISHVQSLRINFAFWQVLRENNEYADALALNYEDLARPSQAVHVMGNVFCSAKKNGIFVRTTQQSSRGHSNGIGGWFSAS